MYYIKDIVENEIVIKRSKFIAIAYPIHQDSDVNDCLAYAKNHYPKASHYTHAYFIGPQAEHAHFSDDGEPSRTAGFPIYDVLKHHEITNIMVVVVRYFGGIKLGAGGLVRAYSQAAASVLNTIQKYQLKRVYRYIFTFPYPLAGKLDQLFEAHGTITHRTFTDTLTYDCLLHENDLTFLNAYQHLIKYKHVEILDELIPA